jgi:AcrR family transcriptional regulator
MDDVAAEAGVTKLIVYRHFDSKEELYRSVLDGVNARIADEFGARVRRAVRPSPHLVVAVDGGAPPTRTRSAC